MSDRSTLAQIRNPVLALPAFAQIRSLDADSRRALRALLSDLRRDATHRADEAWRRHKGPMAAYWRACAVYAGHIGRALR